MPSALTPIATTTLGSAASSITFSSIPATYTHLLIVANLADTNTTVMYGTVRYNGDTAGNYSYTRLIGNGTAASSSAAVNQTAGVDFGTYPGNGSNSNMRGLVRFSIFNYAGSAYKTNLTESSGDWNGNGDVIRSVGLWRSTSAITSIDVRSGNQFAANSTFTLFGIKAA